MSTNTWSRIYALVGAGAAMAVGALDAWRFHAFGVPLDVALIVGGLAALGVPVAAATMVGMRRP